MQLINRGEMDEYELRVDSQPLSSETWGPPIYPHLDHRSPSQECAELNPGISHIFGTPNPLGSTVAGSSIPHWPSMLNSQQKYVRPIQAGALPHLPMRISANSSKLMRKPCKPLTTEAREELRKFAEANPRATYQKIADIFNCSTRTVRRHVCDQNGTCKSTTRSKSAFTKRVYKKLAPNDAEATLGITSWCPPANRSLGGTPTVNSISAPQNECVGSRSHCGLIIDTAVSASRPSTSSPSSSSTQRPPKSRSPLASEPGRSSSLSGSQQTFTCASSANDNNSHWLPNPPAIKPPAQNHVNPVLDLHEGTFTASSQAGNANINRTTTVQPAETRNPSQTQELAISPEEACKALGTVIRFCEQQRDGFVELQEGVLLGTLNERLRHICG